MAVSVFTADHDAEFYATGTDLATTRALSNADSIDDTGTTLDVGGKSTTPYQLWRIGLTFDTSSIPSDAIVTAAQLNLYAQSHVGTTTHRVVDFNPASGYPYALSDFGNFTTTTWGTRTFYTGNVGVFPITLSTSCVVKAGTTHLGIRVEGDVTNDPTTAVGSTFRSIRYGGGSTFWPRLSVTWFPATQTASPSLFGTGGGTYAPTAQESVTVTPSLFGVTGGVLASVLSNAGGDVFAPLLGNPSGVFVPTVSVGGVTTVNPSLLGNDPGVLGGTVGPKPRLIGPFYALVFGSLDEGSRSTISALLRRQGDEPLPLTDALGVDLKLTDQDGNVLVDWDACSITSRANGLVTCTVPSTALAGAREVDVLWRIRWSGGTTLVPTARGTMGVL